MSPKNEELLYFLLWTTETMLRPTWRNVEESFEAWAWRRGLGRRLAALADQQLVEPHPEPNLNRVVRLTEEGRRLAWGGRDPIARWSRPWDQTWRLVLFDLPVDRGGLRRQLLRTLHRSHFGYLQKSVWVSPDPPHDIRAALRESRVDTEVFLVIEGRPAAGESDAEIVHGAWNFDLINQNYRDYLTAAKKLPSAPHRAHDWARQEKLAWQTAARADPMLPAALLPAGYLGREAYQRRKEVLHHLATLRPAG